MGGGSDYFYEVSVPEDGQVSAHDLAWYSEAQIALEEDDVERAERCASSYWGGEPYFDREASVTEYMTRSAVVVRDVSFDDEPPMRPDP